jgi:hypothetical protein
MVSAAGRRVEQRPPVAPPLKQTMLQRVAADSIPLAPTHPPWFARPVGFLGRCAIATSLPLHLPPMLWSRCRFPLR